MVVRLGLRLPVALAHGLGHERGDGHALFRGFADAVQQGHVLRGYGRGRPRVAAGVGGVGHVCPWLESVK